jgi:hypothetical protein
LVRCASPPLDTSFSPLQELRRPSIWEKQPASITRHARIDIALLAQPPQQDIQSTGVAAEDLRTAMGKNRLLDKCLTAPVELRSDGRMADQGSGPPPNQRTREARAIADIDVYFMQRMGRVWQPGDIWEIKERPALGAHAVPNCRSAD